MNSAAYAVYDSEKNNIRPVIRSLIKIFIGEHLCDRIGLKGGTDSKVIAIPNNLINLVTSCAARVSQSTKNEVLVIVRRVITRWRSDILSARRDKINRRKYSNKNH